MNNQWMNMYYIAKNYFIAYGNLEIPQTYITEDGIKLGRWIQTQRQAYKNRSVDKRKNLFRPLSDEQVKLLESIGMIWDKKFKNWVTNYERVKQYYEKNGNLFGIEDQKLKVWLETQNIAYLNRFISNNERTNKLLPLTDEQVYLLNEIGVDFNNKEGISSNWMKNYCIAKKYYLENGDLRPDKNLFLDGNIVLERWLRNQRAAFENRFLPVEQWKNKCVPLNLKQVEMLESIGMVWSIREFNFVKKPITKYKKVTLEIRFLEFLSDYIKENDGVISSYYDVKRIADSFVETFGCEDNHYKRRV